MRRQEVVAAGEVPGEVTVERAVARTRRRARPECTRRAKVFLADYCISPSLAVVSISLDCRMSSPIAQQPASLHKALLFHSKSNNMCLLDSTLAPFRDSPLRCAVRCCGKYPGWMVHLRTSRSCRRPAVLRRVRNRTRRDLQTTRTTAPRPLPTQDLAGATGQYRRNPRT